MLHKKGFPGAPHHRPSPPLTQVEGLQARVAHQVRHRQLLAGTEEELHLAGRALDPAPAPAVPLAGCCCCSGGGCLAIRAGNKGGGSSNDGERGGERDVGRGGAAGEGQRRQWRVRLCVLVVLPVAVGLLLLLLLLRGRPLDLLIVLRVLTPRVTGADAGAHRGPGRAGWRLRWAGRNARKLPTCRVGKAARTTAV